MLRRHIVLLIAIRQSDGNVKAWRPPLCFSRRAGYEPAPGSTFSLPIIIIIIIPHNTIRLHNTDRYAYSHPNLKFLQHYTDTLPTHNVVCPSGAWFENRPHLTPSIRLARNPKRVIVQWVGIRTDIVSRTTWLKRDFYSYSSCSKCSPRASAHFWVHWTIGVQGLPV